MRNFCSSSSAESHPPTGCYRPQRAKLNISAKLEKHTHTEKKNPHALLHTLGFPSVRQTHIQRRNKIALQEGLWEKDCEKATAVHSVLD